MDDSDFINNYKKSRQLLFDVISMNQNVGSKFILLSCRQKSSPFSSLANYTQNRMYFVFQ